MVTTIVYGQKQVWKNRKDAINYFLGGVFGSEGSERDRYINIISQLQLGFDVCSDEQKDFF